MDSNIYLNSDELAHWGIKGMRWGIRRYQNKDGSLTPRGKKRYNEEMAKLAEEEKTLKRRKATQAKLDKLEAKRKAIADQKKELDDADAAKKKRGKGDDADTKSDKPTKKSVKDMTDEELASALVRSRMESEYARLNPEPAPKDGLVKRFMNDAVKPAMINAGRNYIEKALAGKVDPDSLEGLKLAYEKTKYKIDRDKLLNPDKYLSEEDKSKRQKREQEKADWDAQLRGHKDAATEAQAKRDAESAQKSHKLEAARAAQERARTDGAHSRFIKKVVPEAEPRQSQSDKLRDSLNKKMRIDMEYQPSDKSGSTSVSSGRSFIDRISSSTPNTSSSNVSSGQSFVGKYDRSSIADLDSEDW